MEIQFNIAKGRESGMPEQDCWEAFFDPECALRRMGLAQGMRTIEFGSGYGTFAIPAATICQQLVVGLDIDPAMVDSARERALMQGALNTRFVSRDVMLEGCGESDVSFDFAIMFNILHIEQPELLLQESYRVLRPGDLLAIMHWRTDQTTPRGPSLSIRPTREQCRTWGESAGFEFVRNVELDCCQWHWGLVLHRPHRKL